MIVFFHFIILISKYLVTRLSKSLSDKYDLSDRELHCTEGEENSVVSYRATIATESAYINGQLRFFPPVYVQRYETVFSILEQSIWREKTKKVVDFGCSELSFFLHLKHMAGIEEILEVDIDENALERGLSKAAPLNSDYLFCKREKPLNVYILSGSIAEYDDCLLGTDAVVAIEVLEHLYPDVLDKVAQNIFHNIRPKIAIFTTPNADFNALFQNNKGFRHPDHKFEWSRKEFCSWTEKITENYPCYSVKFYGIGHGPEGSENLGCCTQLAVFTKIVGFEDENLILEPKGINNYRLIRKYEYPFFIDDRSDEEKILHEVLYRIKFTMFQDHYYNHEDCSFEFPLSEFMGYISEWCDSQEKLKELLLDHGFYVKEKSECDVLLYCGQSERSYRADEESSVEYNIPEDVPETDFLTENWELECGDGNFNEKTEKVYEEELLCFLSSRSLQEAENSKPLLESNRLKEHQTNGLGKTDFLPVDKLSVLPLVGDRRSLSVEYFDYVTLSEIPTKKKKVRNNLFTNRSRNLVRSSSLP